jgi:hypothetical protein
MAIWMIGVTSKKIARICPKVRALSSGLDVLLTPKRCKLPHMDDIHNQ